MTADCLSQSCADLVWVPLSSAQQRLWFFSRLESVSSAYNLGGVLWLDGVLDLAALRYGLDQLLARHSALRLVFAEQDGVAKQAVLPVGPMPLEQVDLSELAAEMRRHAVVEQGRAFVERHFDLGHGPQVRCALYRLQTDRHALVLSMHHIVSDAWSVRVLFEDMAEFYLAHQQHRAPTLSTLPLQYCDYAKQQRQWLASDEGRQQLNYWRAQLGEEQPALVLPADVTHPAQADRRAAYRLLELEPQLIGRLRGLAKACGATLFSVLLAALQLQLARLSGQREVRIGVPVAGRGRGHERLVGFFVNTLVLAGQPLPGLSVREWISRTRQCLRQGLNHQQMPFEQLVDALAPARSLGQQPLFQVAFNYRRQIPLAANWLPGINVHLDEFPASRIPFDLALDAQQGEGEQVQINFAYAADLFDTASIERLIAGFTQLLGEFVARPDSSLAQLRLHSAAEQERLAIWNQCKHTYDPSRLLPELIAEQARLRPDAIALVHGSERLSYAELEAQANRLGHLLIEHGVGAEARVGLSLERGNSMIVGLLAILKAGGAFVPLDPGYPRERLAFMVEDSGLQWLITSSDLAGRLPAVETLCLDRLDLSAYPATTPGVVLHPLNLAYLIYTSGSTGQPKGVAVNHAGLTMHVQTVGQRYGMTPDDVELHFASISFDGAVERWAVPLAFGSRLVIRDQQLWSAEQTCQVLQDESVTIAIFPPSYAVQLLDWIESQSLTLNVRSWTLGGEAFTRETYERMQRVLMPKRIVNGYGPTETVVTPLIWEAFAGDELEAAYAPIGTPVGPRTCYVLDNELNLLPIGVAGELYIGGEVGLARGYYQRPDLTAERFLPDPFGEPGERMYRTGDLVRWREDGALDYLGRVDHQVKIRGFRIELGEIESQLLALPQVAEAVVMARDTPSGKQLVGYLVGRGELDLSAIKQQLAALLPNYMLPAQLLQLDSLPLTPARKLDRAALPEPQWQSADYQAPANDNERLLAAIWQQVLGVERVGRSDHFFELGGDSIVALQVVSRARQQGLALAPRDLFQQQTLAELAAVARPASESTQAQGPVSGELPLTPIQAHFFALGQAEPAHWNQSLYLELQRPLDPALLELTLQALVLHHDALRLRFAEGRQWYAAHDALNTPLLISREVDSNAEAEELCNQVQRSLDLAAGPLLRALYLRQAGQSDRLLLVIHHLVVDGVSWRVLLEDLPRTYERLAAGQPPALPAKTCSYQDWAEHLQRWARSEQAAAELDNWCTRLSGHDQPLPQDLPAVTATFGEKREVRIGLDRASSKRLLTQVPSALGVRINDLLLTALTRALCAWSGQGALRVNLEGHGREPLAAGLDPSRTLGWFTSLYPLRLPHVGDLREQLRNVQTQLQQVANGGAGYGALRWLGEPAAQAALAALPQAQVTFNYLGQYTGGEATGWFRPLAGGGAQQAANNPLGSLLTVNGQMFDGVLSLAWEYAPSQLHESTVQGLAEAYHAELLALLDLAGIAAGAGPAALLQLSRQTPPAAPLFCPHPVTGRVTGYQPLTARLEGQRAVFGLQCRSFVDPEWRDASLAEMADAYLAALLRQQPEGPYHLLGWSLGGSLALELAARLEARGQTVAFLGLVDCYVPGTEIPEDDSRHPHARARLGEHLRLLVPELSAGALDDLFARLEPLPPLDWPQACKQWLLGQGLDAVASESLQELLFAWSVEQQMRRLCTGYALPSVKARPHCWWASRPEGRAAVLEQGLEQALGRAASHSLIDADHLGIVRAPQALEQVSRYLAALS